MNDHINIGQTVYAADGEKLGTVKEVVAQPEITYFRVGVRMRPDYWLGTNWVKGFERRDDGEEGLVLDFDKKLVNNYKLPAPA